MSMPNSTIDVSVIRRDFPILNQRIHRDRPLIFFDSGASSQRPEAVVRAMSEFYQQSYANVHRGIHWLSEQASARYEQARQRVAEWIGANQANEVIFCSGTTAGINLVARAWGDANVHQGDEILLTLMEHHSNIVPWQQLAERSGARVRFVELTTDGQLDLDDFESKLNERTRIVAVTAISNVLGTIVPVREIVKRAHDAGAIVLVDAAQHVPHEPTDVRQWGADFVAFSAHKMMGPSGIGVLWGRESILEQMPPFLGGGSMIQTVTVDGYVPGDLPARFEAGTPPIAEAVGLHAAIDYLKSIGMTAISDHERELTRRAHEVLQTVEGVTLLGPSADCKAGIVSFSVEGCAPQDVALFLDRRGVAIRAGHHCAMPLHQSLGMSGSCRASFYVYNTTDEVQQFAEILSAVIHKLRG